MNRVHEQCPKIDSRIVLSKTGSKTGRVHLPHPAPACREPALCARSPSARAPPPAPSACPVPLPAHPVCIAIQTAFLMPFSLQYTRVYCHTVPITLAPGHNTINCIAIQFFQQPASSIAIHLTHCTPLLLQYNPPLLHIQGHYITIQCLSYNTIGQYPKSFYAPNLLLLFFHFFFFSFISSYWKIKIYIYIQLFFFHFP